jgi:Leucine-rich repeat (LRR) protein
MQELHLSFSDEIVSCSRLAPCLLNLTTLSALTLSCQKVHQYDAPMLAIALASCTSLKRLEFHVKRNGEEGCRFKQFSGDYYNLEVPFGNESAEIILKVLPALSQLTHLHLSRDLGCRVLPEVLPKLSELRHLHLDDLNAWGSAPEVADIGVAIGSLGYLQHLSAADNFLTDVEMEPLLATLPISLTYLNLAKNRLPSDFPRLSQLKWLRVLNLHSCGVTHAVAERFTALTELEKLTADDAEMPPEATEALIAALPTCITHVEIMGSHFPVYAAPLLQELKSLKVLIVSVFAIGTIVGGKQSVHACAPTFPHSHEYAVAVSRRRS